MKNTVFKNIVKGALSLKLVLAIALAVSTSTVVHAQQSSSGVQNAQQVGQLTRNRNVNNQNLQDLANISPSAGGEDGANDVSDADPS